MVFFLGSLMISCSLKLESHHDHHPKHPSSNMFSTSLHTFESEVPKSLFHLSSLDSKESNFTTLEWIQKCIQILPAINKAFKKLVLDMDYPITSWELASIDEHLNYSLNSMESLNSITSSLTQLRQARMTLSHGLTLVEEQSSSTSPIILLERLKLIQQQPRTSSSNKTYYGNRQEVEEMRFCSDKEWIIHQALMIKKSVWRWMCNVIESSIRGDVQLEMNKEFNGFSSPLVSLQLSNFCAQVRKRKGLLQEVADVNEAVVGLIAITADEKGEQISDAVRELKGKVDVLGKMLAGIEEDLNRLFSEVLVRRNELLDGFQQRKD